MFNSFGHLFRVTTWGESHGPALGCVVDGCPPGIPLDRGRHPALARRPPPRPEPLHHPAPGGRPGRDPLRHLRGADHRHADLAPDPQHRPALQGLLRDRAEVPPRPRRPHLPPEVRHPRLPRRRPLLGPRDRRPRRRRRRRPRRPRPARAAGPHPRRPRADGRPHDRPRRLGLGRAAAATPSGAPTPRAAETGPATSTACASPATPSAPIVELVAEGVPAGLGAPIYAKLDSDIAMALMTINAVKGVEIGAGMAAAALTGSENADEIFMGNDGRPPLLLQPRRRHPRRHLLRPGHRRPLRGQAHLLDPHPPPHHHRDRRGDRDRHQGPPRPLRRHPRRPGGRGDARLRHPRPLPPPPRPGRRRRRPHRLTASCKEPAR